MRPRIHPSAMVPYLEKEVAAAKEEAERLRKELAAMKEELELKKGELSATRQDLDHTTLESLEAEIKTQWRTWS